MKTIPKEDRIAVTCTRYAVLVRCSDGRRFLASGEGGGVRLHNERSEALEFADELAEHIPPRRNLRVVRVFVRTEVME